MITAINGLVNVHMACEYCIKTDLKKSKPIQDMATVSVKTQINSCGAIH